LSESHVGRGDSNIGREQQFDRDRERDALHRRHQWFRQMIPQSEWIDSPRAKRERIGFPFEQRRKRRKVDAATEILAVREQDSAPKVWIPLEFPERFGQFEEHRWIERVPFGGAVQSHQP
jgi:hypothetical protein